MFRDLSRSNIKTFDTLRLFLGSPFVSSSAYIIDIHTSAYLDHLGDHVHLRVGGGQLAITGLTEVQTGVSCQMYLLVRFQNVQNVYVMSIKFILVGSNNYGTMTKALPLS